MILHPAILALVSGSFLTAVILLLALLFAIRILARWDITSGSEVQLNLERQTYLVSTIVTYAFLFQVLSFFLYIFIADNIHGLFTGAMCAAGSLHVNGYGYPVLLLKMATVLGAGVWLILNHADTLGHDYPLVRIKYAFLLVLVPCILIESILQLLYFLNLHADVITSCCGSLFGRQQGSLASDLAGLPAGPAMAAFYGAILVQLVLGLVFWWRGRGGYLFSLASAAAFLVSIVSVISFICLYIYNLPTHHCPFCILQREYGYMGYLLYATILGGGVTGIGVGALMPFRSKRSLAHLIPPLQRRLAAASLILFGLFVITVTCYVVFSPLTLTF